MIGRIGGKRGLPFPGLVVGTAVSLLTASSLVAIVWAPHVSYQAAGRGQMAVVDFLLDKGFPVNSVDVSSKGNRTALYRAVEGGYLPLVKLMIRRGAALQPPSHSITDDPIAMAAQNGHTECLRYLLEVNRALDTPAVLSEALHMAVLGRQYRCAAELITWGAPVDTTLLNTAGFPSSRHRARAEGRKKGSRSLCDDLKAMLKGSKGTYADVVLRLHGEKGTMTISTHKAILAAR